MQDRVCNMFINRKFYNDSVLAYTESFSFLLKTFWQNVKITGKENSYEGGKCCFYI